jgi:uncharacterized membrane protein YcaP (DUF421 family)
MVRFVFVLSYSFQKFCNWDAEPLCYTYLMWNNLFSLSLSPLNLIVRAIIVYFAVLILLRISGKKQVGQMGALELVTVLLISNAVQNSMNGGDNSLLGGLILATVLIFLSLALSWLSYKSKIFERVFEGTPRLLIHDGKVIQNALEKERLSHSELHVLMRRQGVHSASEVKTAVLEASGTLSLVRYQDLHSRS